MATTVFVYNLSSTVTSSSLGDMFETVGNVVSANIVLDRDSGLSIGQGAVEMSTMEEAKNAVLYFQQRACDGIKLVVLDEGLHTGEKS